MINGLEAEKSLFLRYVTYDELQKDLKNFIAYKEVAGPTMRMMEKFYQNLYKAARSKVLPNLPMSFWKGWEVDKLWKLEAQIQNEFAGHEQVEVAVSYLDANAFAQETSKTILEKLLIYVGEATSETEAMRITASYNFLLNGLDKTETVFHIVPLLMYFKIKGHTAQQNKDVIQYLATNHSVFTTEVENRKKRYGAAKRATLSRNDGSAPPPLKQRKAAHEDETPPAASPGANHADTPRTRPGGADAGATTDTLAAQTDAAKKAQANREAARAAWDARPKKVVKYADLDQSFTGSDPVMGRDYGQKVDVTMNGWVVDKNSGRIEPCILAERAQLNFGLQARDCAPFHLTGKCAFGNACSFTHMWARGGEKTWKEVIQLQNKAQRKGRGKKGK
ncbi:unnamed protein product [Amoebophrya sp. A25]|nr:unnamed protein product [Amoebophrya sp. A25]|eukprot:GSA25T00001804001.1